MNRWQHFLGTVFAVIVSLVVSTAAQAEGNGQEDLNEALRVKITARGLRELNQVIELLEGALDKGLDVENSDFAEQMLSESLLERAGQLARVVEDVPKESLSDARIQRIRALAVSDLRRVMEYDNPPSSARSTLAKLLAVGSDDERTEARELLDKLIDGEEFEKLSASDQAEAFAERASLQADVSKALADFARAIELNPDEADLRLSRAQFQFEHDDVEGALAEVAAVVEKTPNQIAARLLQAQILRTLERYDEALTALEKLADLAPASPVPHQYRGEIYREMGEFDKAIEEFTRVLQIQPGLDLALIRRAESYYFADRFDEALADVDAVLRDDPDDAMAHGLRGEILAAKNQFVEAIEEMTLLAKELPGQPDIRVRLASYYVLNDQPREAIGAYTEALDLDADHFLARRGRGDSYLSVGDHAAAIADFAKALKLDGEDSALLNNYAWVLATSPDDAVRDDDLALELAEKACELTDHAAPHILSTLGAAYAEAGDFDKAVEWLRKGLEINSEVLEEASAAADEKQIAALHEMAEELGKELASYEAKKPWRERQTEDGDAAPDESSEDGPDRDKSDADADQAADDSAARP